MKGPTGRLDYNSIIRLSGEAGFGAPLRACKLIDRDFCYDCTDLFPVILERNSECRSWPLTFG